MNLFLHIFSGYFNCCHFWLSTKRLSEGSGQIIFLLPLQVCTTCLFLFPFAFPLLVLAGGSLCRVYRVILSFILSAIPLPHLPHTPFYHLLLPAFQLILTQQGISISRLIILFHLAIPCLWVATWLKKYPLTGCKMSNSTLPQHRTTWA